MKSILLLLTLGLGALVLTGGGCTTTEDTTTNTNATVVDVDEDEVMEADDADEDTEVEVEDEDAVAAAGTISVTNSGNTFTPADVTINVGDSVEFSVGATHNVVEVTEADYTANGKTLKDSGFEVDFGGTKTVTFDEPGTYYYVCQPHVGLGMKGTVIVE